MNSFTTGQTALDFTATPYTVAPAAAPPSAPTDESPDRPSREDRLAAAYAVLAAGLADVRDDPAALKAYLRFSSHFRDYSVRNQLLIFAQRPTARFCKGYRAWQAVGRQVSKGQRGLTILAPVVRKPTKAEVVAGADPDTQSVVGFRPTTVFCYSQTAAVEGSALVYTPPTPRLDADDPDGLTARLEAVARALGFEVVYLDTGYADGSCSFARRTISVQRSLSPADQAAVLCHELAHAVAHDPAAGGKLTRAQRELQAEASAYVVLAGLSLDSSKASLPYLSSWASGDDDALLAELGAVDRIARDLLDRIEAMAA